MVPEELGEGSYAERRSIMRVLGAIATSRLASAAYQVIADEVRSLLGAGTVVVGLATPQTESMDFVAVSGRDPAEIVGLRVASEDTLANPALRSGRAMLLRSDGPTGLRSGAIAPILTSEGVAGAIIAVDGEHAGSFTEEDLDVLTLFANAAGLVVDCEGARRALADKERELAALYDAARTITSTVNLQAVLDSVLQAISQHLPVQTAAIYLLNDERSHLFITADRGLSDDEREVQLAADAGIAGEVLRTGESRILGDTQDAADADTVSPTPRCRSLMVAPIRSAGEVLGLLTVTSSQPAAYRAEDLHLLEAVATQAGIAIHNATLYEDATSRAEAANALFTFSQRVGATLDVREVLDCVAETTMSLLGVDGFAAMLMDHRDGRLHAHAVRGLDEEAFGAIRPRSGEGIAGWVYAWTCPTAVADIAADARNRSMPIHQLGIVSCLCVPIGSVQGVLLALSSRRRLFTVAEIELLYTIANQASLAITNATAYQRAQERSLAMRRYFRRFAAAIGSAADTNQTLQLVADVALDVMKADRCAIYATTGDELVLRAESRLAGRCAPDQRIPVGTGLTGAVAATGRILTSMPLSDDDRARVHAWHGKEQLASYVGIPLKERRRITGVLELLTQDPRSFTPDELRLLSQFVLKARLGERLGEEVRE